MTTVLMFQVLLILIQANLAFAADGTTAPAPSGSQQTAVPEASCEAIDNPPENTQYLVTTVVEEEFAASQGEDANAKIITCFRVTTKKENGVTWESEYKSSCSPVAGSVECKRVQVYFTKTGAALLYTYIGQIYRWGAGTIGVVSVLYLVWGGIEITTAGDNTGKIDEAKKKIIQSITGLVLLFMSGVILYTINPNFFTAG